MTPVPVIPSGTLLDHLYSTWLAVGNRLFATHEWLRKLLITSGLLLLMFLTTNAQTTWTARPQTGNKQLSDVAYGGGIYVAVSADDGLIRISTNGISWTNQVAGTTVAKALSSIVYAAGKFVTVGNNGRILSSTDGLTWTPRVSGTGTLLQGVTYGAGQFLAVGFGGVIITSTDGATWVVRAADPSANVNLQFQDVSYGGGQFVAVGGNGLIQTSPNGINWTTRTSGTVAELYGVTAGNNGLWVAVGTNSTIVTSPDGVVWTPQTVVGINTFLSSVAFNTAMGQFVAVANTSNRLLTSPNGLIWTAHPSGTSSLKGVRYLNGQFIAVGDYGTIRSSPDGTTWKPLTITGQMHFEGAAYGNGSYVAVGGYPTDPDIQTSTVSLAVTSGNGVNYEFATTQDPVGTNNGLQDVAFGNGLFVAVGKKASIQTSADGNIWQLRYEDAPKSLNAIAYGGGQFVAVGPAGLVLRSTNGLTWVPGSSIPATNYLGITYANGQFVAVGFNGAIGTSPDGITWTVRTSGTGLFLTSVAYGNGAYVAVGIGGTMVRSVDGVTWSSVPSFTLYAFYAVTFGNGQFVVVGEAFNSESKLFTSPDGITWTARSSNTFYTLRGVTHGNGLFVAVGDGAAVATSPDDAVVPPANQPPVAPVIANTTGTVGQVYSQTIPLFSDPEGLPLMYSVMGLPPGLLVTAGGNMVGPPTTAGVYPITVTATDQGGLTASASYTITINPVGGGGFQLTDPVYNCQSGAFTFQTSGGDGSLIEYMAIGITGWTTNPNQFVDFGLRTATDAQPLTIKARQNGVEVTLSFDIQAFCGSVPPVEAPVDPPVGGMLTLLEPTYDCQSGAITFLTSGGDGSLIEYMAIGITGWTINPNQFVDFGLRTATDAQPLTLKARQSGVEVTRPFNIQAKCVPIMARRSTPSAVLEVRLGAVAYPNPTNESFTVDIDGIVGQQVRLFLVDALGHTVVDRPIQVAGSRHREQFRLDQQPAGLYLLRVSTPGQMQMVKVIKL